MFQVLNIHEQKGVSKKTGNPYHFRIYEGFLLVNGGKRLAEVMLSPDKEKGFPEVKPGDVCEVVLRSYVGNDKRIVATVETLAPRKA